MKRIEKILILILYTFGLFAIVGLIAVFSNNGPAFKDYTEKSQDENIAVVTQVLEQRKSAKELSAEYEKSEYNVHFFIKKTNSSNLTDIYVYVAAETEEGIRYVQSTSAKSLEGSATVSSTIKVTNGSSKSSKFAVNEIIVEDENVTHLNRIPKAFYVKVAYKETVNKEKVQHELNFKVDYNKAKDSENYDSFEKRNVTENGIELKSDYISITFGKIYYEKSSSVKVAYNEFRLKSINIIKANLPSNVSISTIHIAVTAKITKNELVNSKYFSENVRLFDYQGTLASNISNSRSCNLSDEYNVEKIYFDVTITLEDGSVQHNQFYVVTAELSE